MEAETCLGPLLASGLWSKADVKLNEFKTIILDGTSIAKQLYIKTCEGDRSASQQQANGPLQLPFPINYIKYNQNIKLLLDVLEHHKIRPIIVYQGTRMESKFGALVSRESLLYESRQRHLREIYLYHNKNVGSGSSSGTINSSPHPSCSYFEMVDPPLYQHQHLSVPDLALVIFKRVINERLQKMVQVANNCSVFQAPYEAHPMIAKLARDNKSPVITQRSEFLFVDVREGFILFEQFWRQHCYPKASGTSGNELLCNIYYNNDFILQNAGMSIRLGNYILPLARDDFIRLYGASLARLKLDLAKTLESSSGKSCKHQANRRPPPSIYSKRMDLIISWLSNKSAELITNMVKGEAVRTKTKIDKELQLMVLEMTTAADFGRRLALYVGTAPVPSPSANQKSISGKARPPALVAPTPSPAIDFIEEALRRRETTAEFIMPLLGQQQVEMGSALPLEDPQTKCSANSMGDRVKILIAAQCRQINLAKMDNKKPAQTMLKPIIISDRVGNSIGSRQINMAHLPKELEHLNMESLMTATSQIKNNNMEALASIRQLVGGAFILDGGAGDWMRLTELSSAFNSVSGEPDLAEEMAVIVSLARFSLFEASQTDEDFVRRYAPNMFKCFIEATTCLLLYEAGQLLNKTLNASVNKYINDLTLLQASDELTMDHQQQKSSMENNKWMISLQIRYLIELLSASCRAFMETNALYHYPYRQPRLECLLNGPLLFNLMYHYLNSSAGKQRPVINESISKILFKGGDEHLSQVKKWSLDTRGYSRATITGGGAERSSSTKKAASKADMGPIKSSQSLARAPSVASSTGSGSSLKKVTKSTPAGAAPKRTGSTMSTQSRSSTGPKSTVGSSTAAKSTSGKTKRSKSTMSTRSPSAK